MTAPDKAFILCAGLGTRLRPITYHTPKPLLPIWGRANLLHILVRLHDWGVRRILINIHDHPDQFIDVLRQRPAGMRIDLSFEPQVLDTGGALQRARWFLSDSPFWLVNGDVTFSTSPAPLLQAFNAHPAPISALWCTATAGPRTVEIQNEHVTSFRSQRAGQDGTYTFCGLHLLSPAILDFIPPAGPSSIIIAYELAMKAGHGVRALELRKSYWADIGTLPNYIAAHRDLTSTNSHPPSLRASRVLSISPGATVATSASIQDCVIGPGAMVGPLAQLRDSYVADCNVNEPCTPGTAILPLRSYPLPETLRTVLPRLGFSSTTTAMPFAPRGSDRSFLRLRDGKRSAVLTLYGASRPENALHAGHTQFLDDHGIPVPKLLGHDTADRWCLMEDCGDNSLLSSYPTLTARQRLTLYQRLLDSVAGLHRPALARAAKRKGLTLAPAFTPTVYRWEHELFLDHFAEPRLALYTTDLRVIRQELRAVATSLLRQPLLLLHRDLQSSNILLQHGRSVFIDYQGMRLGPALYDVASLLADPYVSLSADVQLTLLRHYARLTHAPIERLLPIFQLAAIQRLCQALGAYGRLTGMGLSAFALHIRPALMMLDRMLGRVDNCPALRRVIRNAIHTGEKSS